jgi:hypothetical protein
MPNQMQVTDYSHGMPVMVDVATGKPSPMPSDPIVYQLKQHDNRAKTAYQCSAARFFERYIAWDNLTTAERDYWRTHVE